MTEAVTLKTGDLTRAWTAFHRARELAYDARVRLLDGEPSLGRVRAARLVDATDAALDAMEQLLRLQRHHMAIEQAYERLKAKTNGQPGV